MVWRIAHIVSRCQWGSSSILRCVLTITRNYASCSIPQNIKNHWNSSKGRFVNLLGVLKWIFLGVRRTPSVVRALAAGSCPATMSVFQYLLTRCPPAMVNKLLSIEATYTYYTDSQLRQFFSGCDRPNPQPVHYC